MCTMSIPDNVYIIFIGHHLATKVLQIPGNQRAVGDHRVGLWSLANKRSVVMSQ